MKCSRCNQENPEGALFCSGCGGVLGNLSEEDARRAAILRPSGRVPCRTNDPDVPRTTAAFGIATISFALSAVLLIAACLTYICYIETIIFDAYPSPDYERADLLEKAFRYTYNLGWIAAAAGFVLVLLGVAERHRRGEAFLWLRDSRVRTAALVVMIALVVAGIQFTAMVLDLEVGITQDALRDFFLRVDYYAGGILDVLLAAAAYLVASSFRQSDRTKRAIA